jgi:hypothetical protein
VRQTLIEETRRTPSRHRAFNGETMKLSMTRLLNIVTLSAALALAGCSTVYKVTKDTDHTQRDEISPEEFFALTGNDQWSVLFVTGEKKTAAIRWAPGDSMCLVSRQDSMTVPMCRIRSVSRTRTIDGYVVYPLMGMIGGALAGVSMPSKDSFKRGDTGLLTGTAIGISAGFTLGIFLPPKNIYVITPAIDSR